MNTRIKKKIEKRKRETIHKIFDAVLDINRLQASQKEITGDHPTVFLSFVGHIGVIEIEIDNHGWVSGADHDKWLRAYVDRPKELERMLRELKESEC